MDASDDKDVVLQKAASDLLDQLKSSLPHFLWHHKPRDCELSEQTKHTRNIVRTSTTLALIKLLEPFQEWPQLLDPELSVMLTPLVETLAASLFLPSFKYYACPPQLSSVTIPLPRAICKLLYTLCKIRGSKVISRFFLNEPKYIELLLNAIHTRSQSRALKHMSGLHSRSRITWEENYIILLWLSHLTITPFDLSSVGSTAAMEEDSIPLYFMLDVEIPSIAQRLLRLGLKYVTSAAKEREAAVTLLVRLVLRPDMVRAGLLGTLVKWSVETLQGQSSSPSLSIYPIIGILSFLANAVNLADTPIIAPFLSPIFHCMQQINAVATPLQSIIVSSAIARKVIVKVLRAVSVKSLQLNALPSPKPSGVVEVVIEDVIQQLLSWLADKDTPVRFAASKALSVITQHLPSSMASEVVEAITTALEENILWTEVELNQAQQPRRKEAQRDLSTVDALEWQGLILTLSHLLFRQCPSPEQLPTVLDALTMALNFEQRTSSGSSTGTSVRDAACFGIWSLARRYSTDQLLAMDISATKMSSSEGVSVSVLQAVADELVAASIADPSGNIRRGASAALQELIGRHPDTITQGINLVQVVDYHAVALRSKALEEVSISAARIDEHYWHVILKALMSWRAIGATDAESRRCASQALSRLSTIQDAPGFLLVLAKVLDNLKRLEGRQVEGRHGLLLAAGAVILEALHPSLTDSTTEISLAVSEFWKIFDHMTLLEDKHFLSSLLRPFLTAEGCSSLISSLAMISCNRLYSSTIQPSSNTIMRCAHLIESSLRLTQTTVVSNTSEAAQWLLPMIDEEYQAIIIHRWIEKLSRKKLLAIQGSESVCGQLAVLGSIYHTCTHVPDLQKQILDSILGLLEDKVTDIESKVACLESLSKGIIPSKVFDARMEVVILNCLQDYTIDQRGDIGSLVRFEAIVTVHTVHKHGMLVTTRQRQELVARVCSLAAEKLDKIRYRAWQCLSDLCNDIDDVELPLTFSDVGQVTSVAYFLQLLSLSSVQWLRRPLLEGIVTSAGAGSEKVLLASRAAIVQTMEGIPQDERSILWDCLLSIIQTEVQNERLVVPVLEVLGFLLSTSLHGNTVSSLLDWHKVFLLVQRCHFKSGNLHKVKAAIDVYVGLSRCSVIRKEALLKLSNMLLHPSAIIRNKAAESLFVVTTSSSLDLTVWSRPPGELKAKVRELQATISSAP
ncbi:hypothetical protein MMC26_007689 [Xylographa opegraphella]|nr:hypothetical protein [Xylographa opegraphella]